MSNIRVVHTECGGPAMDDDSIHPDFLPPFLTGGDFTLTCLTCMDEITDRSELSLSEYMMQ